MLPDILGAVNDFILAYCAGEKARDFLGIPDVPTCPDILREKVLEQSQIVRGWQNVVSALPKDTQTYVVLTLLSGIRHGTNVHSYVPVGTDYTRETTARLAEHIVQVDVCSAYPQNTEITAKAIADMLEMLTRDPIAVDFYAPYGITACYADDVRSAAAYNESEQWEARYIVTLHLTAWTEYGRQLDAFSNVGVYLENVDVHHPITTD